VHLSDRGLLAVGGGDRLPFLQGLISNDIDKVGPERAIYAALLTPQGKVVHDFFALAEPGGARLLLDCERGRIADLERRLAVYRLRADVTLEDASEIHAVVALIGEGAAEAAGLPPQAGRAVALDGGVVFVDPRLAAAGARAVLPGHGAVEILDALGFAGAEPDDYDRWRLGHGLPDGSRDILVEKSLALECGFDELNGVDYDKGCYVGQELTARTHHRGKVRKRLVPVRIEGEPPAPGAPVLLGDKNAGEMRSAREGRGIALLRTERVAEAAQAGAFFTAGAARLTAEKPDWAVF
jgi:folate-binding protein YgfZ